MYGFSMHQLDWLFRLADGRCWSTREAAYVDEAFAEAWLARSGHDAVPASPKDEAGEHSEQGLHEALEFYGLPKGELAMSEELRTLTSSAADEAAGR